MKLVASIMFTTAILIFTFGCSGGKDDALTVAEKFWNALHEKDLEKARSYATEETAGSLTLNEDAENQKVDIEFGDVIVEEGRTKVQTMLHTTTDESETSVELETVLVREDGEWKVDVNMTMMSIFGGAMEQMVDEMSEAMEDLGKTMAEEMQKSMEKMSASMSENVSTKQK